MGHVVMEGSVEGERFRPLRFFLYLFLYNNSEGH